MSIALDLIRQHMARNPVTTILDLFTITGSREETYAAIAHGDVLFDFERDLVLDEQAPVYRDESIWRADQALRIKPPVDMAHGGVIRLEIGAKCIYDGVTRTIIELSGESIWLTDETGSLVEITRRLIPALLATYRLAPPPNTATGTGHQLIAQATPEELKKALADFRVLKPWITGEIRSGLPSRTLRRKMASYRDAEANLGHGLAGLIANTKKRGNRNDRLTKAVEDKITELLNIDFLTTTAPNFTSGHRLLNNRLREAGLPSVSLKTFSKRITKLDPVKVALARHGHKIANAMRPPHPPSDLPASGDRAFEVGHIDSTQVDLELISERTGAGLPKAWITVMINANPPMPLGFHLALHKPRLESILMTVRDCVRRHHRLPDQITYDLGPEHAGTTFEMLEAAYKVSFLRRPRGNPRFGATMESFFNTFNQYLIHQLKGSTK